MNDHDILVETHTLVKELWDATYGNGQPGTLTRLAQVEASLASTSSTGAKWGGAAGGVTAVIAGAIVLVLDRFGIKVGG